MLNFSQKWTWDRDTVAGAVFVFPALVIAFQAAAWQRPTPLFWVCSGIALTCLFAAKHWWVPIAATALYAFFPLLGAAVFTRRPDATIGAGACAAALGLVWWIAERPEHRARRAFAKGRACPTCNRQLRQQVLHRPIIGETQSDEHWCYRCSCGEITLFDLAGNAKHVLPGPPPSADPAA